MALAACDWEIRTDGDDGNGGGFERGAAGTDYCQQAAAQKSGADLEIHGTTNTDVKPTAAGVAAADVGNLVRISAGTDWTAGWYSIKSIQGDYWRLDRSPSAAANVNLGTYKMGGALASLGGFGAIIANSSQHRVTGHIAHIRSGTYTIANTSVNTSQGPINISALAENNNYGVYGYDQSAGRFPASGYDNSSPLIEVADGVSIGTNVGAIGGTNTATYRITYYRNIRLDGRGQTHTGFRNVCGFKCESTRFTNGFSGGGVHRQCKAYVNSVGFSYCNALDCSSYSNTSMGYQSTTSSATQCIAYRNGGHGIEGHRAHQCIAAYNTGRGIVSNTDTPVDGTTFCLSVGNSNYGYAVAYTGHWRCFGFNNTSGLIIGSRAGVVQDTANLTANPFLCPVSQTTVTYTASTRTLTKTGAFADVGVGYRINITSGTAVTPGKYWIASKTSNDAVVLAKSPGASNASDVVIDYDFQLNRVAGGGKELREMVDDNGARPFGYWSSDPALPDVADVKVSEEYGDGGDEYTGTLAAGGTRSIFLPSWIR